MSGNRIIRVPGDAANSCALHARIALLLRVCTCVPVLLVPHCFLLLLTTRTLQVGRRGDKPEARQTDD